MPSIGETYVHLLILDFLLTLSQLQKDTFLTILSRLIPSAISVGQTGTSPIFFSGATRLPTSHDDVRHFYTDHVTSILKYIPAAVTQIPRQDGNTYLFSSYYNCTQHFLAWGPPLVDLMEEFSSVNGPLCKWYPEIVDTCGLL